MDRLKGKTAIITGAASGMGKAQALTFAREGAQVVLADLDLEGVNKTVEGIRRLGGNAIGLKADVTVDKDIDQLVSKAISAFGKISILSNTAGMFDQNKPLLDTPEDLWNKILQVNLTGVYKLTSKVLPHMLEQQYGVIVNVASIAGLTAGGGGIAYTSSKHAVVGFTKQLNTEYGHQGIRANVIAPGLIETPMIKDLIADPNFGGAVKRIPAGRCGQPQEVANLALFLASDESSYIYGAVINIDGGSLSTLRGQ